MTGLSDYSAKNLLNQLTGQVSPVALGSAFLALDTAVGSDDGTGFTEVTGGSYARVQVAGQQAVNASTAAGSTPGTNDTLHFAATPAWITVGMLVFDNAVPGAIAAGTTVVSKTGTTVVLSAFVGGAGVGSSDSISFSAFARATGSGPVTMTNAAAIAFVVASANWGTVIGFRLMDALTSGNMLAWDYLGNFAWLPAEVSSASPGVITAKAHGFSVADIVIFSTEYGGTAPSFSASNFTGQLAVAHSATDTFDVTNAATPVNTSSTGSGSVRKIASQLIPSGITATFAASTLNASAA